MPRDEPVERQSRRIDGRIIGGLILLVVLLVFVVQNRNETALTFLVFDFTAPLWLMLAITVAVSLVVGFVFGRRSRND